MIGAGVGGGGSKFPPTLRNDLCMCSREKHSTKKWVEMNSHANTKTTLYPRGGKKQHLDYTVPHEVNLVYRITRSSMTTAGSNERNIYKKRSHACEYLASSVRATTPEDTGELSKPFPDKTYQQLQEEMNYTDNVSLCCSPSTQSEILNLGAHMYDGGGRVHSAAAGGRGTYILRSM